MTSDRGNIMARRRRPMIPEDPKDRVIVSIPYSGTRFLQHSLKTPRCAHTYNPPERLSAYVSDAQHVVVPLRRPEDNWASWARRHPDGVPWDKRIAEFERSYMGMAWFLQTTDKEVHIIKIGEPTTRHELVEVSKVLGVDPALETDKKGSTDEGDKIYEYDVSHLYKIYKFVKENYDRI